MVERAREEDTPSKPESTYEDGKLEGEVTPPTLSLPCETLPPLNDILSQQAGVAVGVHRSKWTWRETGLSAGLPPLTHLMLVSLVLCRSLC
jgi:hypothetical protein